MKSFIKKNAYSLLCFIALSAANIHAEPPSESVNFQSFAAKSEEPSQLRLAEADHAKAANEAGLTAQMHEQVDRFQEDADLATKDAKKSSFLDRTRARLDRSLASIDKARRSIGLRLNDFSRQVSDAVRPRTPEEIRSTAAKYKSENDARDSQIEATDFTTVSENAPQVNDSYPLIKKSMLTKFTDWVQDIFGQGHLGKARNAAIRIASNKEGESANFDQAEAQHFRLLDTKQKEEVLDTWVAHRSAKYGDSMDDIKNQIDARKQEITNAQHDTTLSISERQTKIDSLNKEINQLNTDFNNKYLSMRQEMFDMANKMNEYMSPFQALVPTENPTTRQFHFEVLDMTQVDPTQPLAEQYKKLVANDDISKITEKVFTETVAKYYAKFIDIKPNDLDVYFDQGTRNKLNTLRFLDPKTMQNTITFNQLDPQLQVDLLNELGVKPQYDAEEKARIEALAKKIEAQSHIGENIGREAVESYRAKTAAAKAAQQAREKAEAEEEETFLNSISPNRANRTKMIAAPKPRVKPDTTQPLWQDEEDLL